MEQEKIKRICNNCENVVYVSETTGECPYCNKTAVFTEPEHEVKPPLLVAVDRCAGRTIYVNPDNVLCDDPETSFQEFIENETPNTTANTTAD
jgi:hypothetical protein